VKSSDAAGDIHGDPQYLWNLLTSFTFCQWESQIRPNGGLRVDFGTRDGATAEYDMIAAYICYLRSVGLLNQASGNGITAEDYRRGQTLLTYNFFENVSLYYFAIARYYVHTRTLDTRFVPICQS